MQAMDDEMEEKRQMADEMMDFGRAGMAKDMRARHGKPPPMDEGAGEEMPAEDPEIPGVEAETAETEGGMPPEAAPEGDPMAKLDPEMLKMLLAALKGG
jgi:hypothetical protein